MGVEHSLTSAERAALREVDALADEMVAFAADLVRIPTVNPPGDRYAECADVIAGRLRAFGYDVELLGAEGLPEHTPERPRINVVGSLKWPVAGPQSSVLHFNGHYDVVPAGGDWTVDPFGGVLREGRLYGRGTSDQKAGIAASIYAVEAIRRAGLELAGTVEQSATPDEESGGFAGVAWLCDAGRIAAGRQTHVVITEPLDPERVCVGHRGVYWFELTAFGHVGHGSMPGLAANAAEAMAHAVETLDERLRPLLGARETLQPVEPPQARRPSLTLTALHGGEPLGGWLTPNVPDRCTAVFDRRFIAEEAFDDVRDEIARQVAWLNETSSGVRFELRDLMRVDPLVGSSETAVAATTAAAIRDALGARPSFIHSPGTYDQKHVLRRAGIHEAIAYGPGRLLLAHQPDEYVEVADLVASARVMALLTMRLLGTGEARRVFSGGEGSKV